MKNAPRSKMYMILMLLASMLLAAQSAWSMFVLPDPPVITSPLNGEQAHSGNVTVSGTAEQGSIVEVYDGTASQGTTSVGNSGIWSITIMITSTGTHTLSATTTTPAGTSESSTLIVVTISNTPAPPVIGTPAGGSSVHTGSTTVSGTAEPGSTIEVLDGSVSQGTTTANGTGNWSLPVSLMTEGTHTLSATATNTSGTSTITFIVITVTNNAPTTPIPVTPISGIELGTSPKITIQASADPDGDPVTYTFEISTSPLFGTIVSSATGLTATNGSVSWTVPITLSDHTVYYWRALATDGSKSSGFVNGEFFVNVKNEPPSVPVMRTPDDNTEVTVLKPVLQVFSSTDPDGDAVTYDFEIYKDSGLTVAAASATGKGTSFSPPASLADNTRYYWRARAVDSHLTASEWTTARAFFVNDGGYNDPPVMTLTAPGVAEPVLFGGSFTIKWTAADPDSAAKITLGYDMTGKDCIGTSIASGIAENDGTDSYAWDVSSLAEGIFHIYGSISDGTTTACVYAAGPILRFNKNGDMNGDGTVDSADALRALRIAQGEIAPTAADFAHGDVAPLVNGTPAPDGVIDSMDVLLIMRKASGDLSW